MKLTDFDRNVCSDLAHDAWSEGWVVQCQANKKRMGMEAGTIERDAW
jgi:hypothetical protein